MNSRISLSRRDFLVRATIASSAAALCGAGFTAWGANKFPPPVALFSKVYQELKLDFEQAADLTAEAGLDGIDCPVRAGGEIPPERALDDMPRYAEALRKRQVAMMLLSTDILDPSTPHTEDILRTAKKLGIHYYRLGFNRHKAGEPAEKLVKEIHAQTKDLAALNKEIGLCALYQNHQPGKTANAGGDLGEMYEIVKDFEPAQIGVAFDLGHAIIVHGDDWPRHFEQLKPHIKVAYIKDAKRPKQFVPFGQGEFGSTDYFKRLKALNLDSPLSMHIEFPWAEKGTPKTKALLAKTLKENLAVLKKWLADA